MNLIVTYNEIRAKELLEDMAMYDRQAMYYPAKDLIFTVPMSMDRPLPRSG